MPQFGYLGQQQPDSNSIDNPDQVPGAVIGDAPGDVRVEAGAQITTASGGKVMLFAPQASSIPARSGAGWPGDHGRR